MSITGQLPRLSTTPIHASKEEAVFEPEALEAALRQALFEMLRGANLVAPVFEAEKPLIVVPDHDSSGLVLKEAVGRTGLHGPVVAPHVGADQFGPALLNMDPVEVSAVWARRQIPAWARTLRNATSLRAASALISDDVREVLAAAAAPARKARHRMPIGKWLRRHWADRNAGANSLPYLIGHLVGSGGCLPSFSLEMALPYRIPKDGEFLALNLVSSTMMQKLKSANADSEIVSRVSVAAAAAFLAAGCGERVGSRIEYNGQRLWGRRMESLTDVLSFIVETSGLVDDPSIFGASSLGSRLVVDTDAGTLRIAVSLVSAHEKVALRRGVRRSTILRDPDDFLHGRVARIGACVVMAAVDALIENEERLGAQSPSGWRARALEQAVRTLAFRPTHGDGSLVGDWDSLCLLREHCRRTGKSIDDFIPREALSDAIRKAQASGLHFSPDLCAAADRRARLPADHPDRLWMITQRQTGAGPWWAAVVGPDLRLVSIAWLHRALMLDNVFKGKGPTRR
jgi:hypothetical protein